VAATVSAARAVAVAATGLAGDLKVVQARGLGADGLELGDEGLAGEEGLTVCGFRIAVGVDF